MKSKTIDTIEKYMNVPRTRSRVKQDTTNAYEKLANRPRARSAVKIEMPDIKLEHIDPMSIPGIQPESTNSIQAPENSVHGDIDGSRNRTRVKQEQDETYLKCALRSKLPARTKKNSRGLWWMKRLRCSICDEQFKSTKIRSDHEREVHDNEVKVTVDLLHFNCDCCNRNYGNIFRYRKHMKTVHEIDVSPERRRSKRDTTIIPDFEDPNNYCISCKHTYPSVKHYRTHLKGVHNIVRGIIIKDQVTEPPIYSPDNRCITCERDFSSKKTYRSHLKQFHKMDLPELNSDPDNFDEERLFCKVCETMFKNYGTFRAHIRITHHAPHITLIQHPHLKPDIYDPNLFCAMCDKTYKRKDSYICHLAGHHTDILPELYIGKRVVKADRMHIAHSQYCSKCRSVFLSKSLYRMHLKKIHGTKLIKTSPDPEDPNSHCTPCNKTYCHKSVYRNHLLDFHSMDLAPITNRLIIKDRIPTVDTVNSYCNVCNKSYTSKFYFIHLLRVHGLDVAPARLKRNVVNRFQAPVIDRENPYCSACDKVYKHKKAHQKHLVKVHGILLPRLPSKILNPNHDIIPDINDANNYCASCDRTYVCPTSYRLHLTRIHKMAIKRVKQEGSNELFNILDDASL